MTPDVWTETTRRGLGGRLRSSLVGAVIGVVLFLISFPLLWKNEGRAVHRARTLREGRGAVVAVAADTVDPNREGALVHLSGLATTADRLTDTVFGLAVNAIRLVREVEMYQWIEEVESDRQTRVGGSEEVRKTYTYRQAWEDSPVDSSSFRRPEGHANPETMAYRSAEVTAEDVRVGAFRLSNSLVGRIGGAEVLPVTGEMFAAMPGEIRAGARLHDRGLYLGESPDSPRVGDLRVRFSQVPPQTVSVVGRQSGDRIGPHALQRGTIEMLRAGEVPPDGMFDQAEHENKVLTWILRAVGLILMSAGIASVFGPLAVATDIIPILGRLSRAGIGLLSFILALCLSLVTIAAAWIAYRPLLGIALLIAAGLTLFGIRSLSPEKQAPVPPPPPPA